MGKKKKQMVPQRPPVTPVDGALTMVPAVLLTGLRTFASPCVHEDGSAAGCTTAGHVLMGLAVLALALAVLRLLSADRRTKRSFDLLLVIVGVVVAVLPGNVVSLCMMATMRCHTIMAPFARVAGVVLAIGAFACELTVDHKEPPTGRKRR